MRENKILNLIDFGIADFDFLPLDPALDVTLHLLILDFGILVRLDQIGRLVD
jgi:hypothetical protein